ncbi:MAG TPA: HdeD family acid-resistance protein [Magnetospirillum sp.]|nr:HdeD family acid-resistance protein [Magnetospirillum sp.]
MADAHVAGPFADFADEAMSARLASNWWAVLIRGLAGIAFGVIAFLAPGLSMAALVLVFGVYMLIDGIFDIVAGFRAARQHERWGLLLLEGVLDIAAGLIALFWPAITVVVLVFIVAAWALVSGVVSVVAAFRLDDGRWLMGLAGVVSVALGLLLFLVPVTGAVVLTWWLGAYALVFGAALTGLAIRLRFRRQVLA